jgi:hypothetical protein
MQLILLFISAKFVDNSTGNLVHCMNFYSYLISPSRRHYFPPSFLPLHYNNTRSVNRVENTPLQNSRAAHTLRERAP